MPEKHKGVEKIDVFKENRFRCARSTFDLLILLITTASTIVSMYTALNTTEVNDTTDGIYRRLRFLEQHQQIIYDLIKDHLHSNREK